MDALEDSDASSASRPNTEDSGLGGHTYLPGTASLVQEIDSKFKEKSGCDVPGSRDDLYQVIPAKYASLPIIMVIKYC